VIYFTLIELLEDSPGGRCVLSCLLNDLLAAGGDDPLFFFVDLQRCVCTAPHRKCNAVKFVARMLSRTVLNPNSKIAVIAVFIPRFADHIWI
jgi:hypothetical protein